VLDQSTIGFDPSRHWRTYFAVLHNTVLSMLGCGP
jgi:hypothetical protein